MNINVPVPNYLPEKGLESHWEPDFLLKTEYANGCFMIKGNKAGLVSLAVQLLALAQEDAPLHTHLHYDDLNSLEEKSVEFIIEKAY